MTRETAGAGGAAIVHFEIGEGAGAVAEQDDLGILAADVDDQAGLGRTNGSPRAQAVISVTTRQSRWAFMRKRP